LPRLHFSGAALFTFLVSILLRGDATPDVRWLITMWERVLNGERAYADIIERRRLCRCCSTCRVSFLLDLRA
jgi:hypothetical protein